MLEEITFKTEANLDDGTTCKLYFGRRDKETNREGSAEHILTDHIDQIDNKFIDLLNISIKNNKFIKAGANNFNEERYESYFEFENENGKKRYFLIVADKDKEGNLRIVTTFIRNKLKKK